MKKPCKKQEGGEPKETKETTTDALAQAESLALATLGDTSNTALQREHLLPKLLYPKQKPRQNNLPKPRQSQLPKPRQNKLPKQKPNKQPQPRQKLQTRIARRQETKRKTKIRKGERDILQRTQDIFL
jgi:hypothetical protein